MVVRQIKQTLPNVYEITLDAGSAFFLRSEYLSLLTKDDMDLMCSGDELTQEQVDDLIQSGMVYRVEIQAINYLSRAEQYRNGLYAKLLKKGFDKNDCKKVLDYLESVNYLNDKRYAGAWLRNRSIDHAEGKSKLVSELLSRGISSDIAKESVDEFFENVDIDEVCKKAYNKISKTQKDKNKIVSSMMRLGFTQKQINQVLQ